MKLLESLPPPLTPEQEKALVPKIKKGDDDALNTLVLANMKEGFIYAKGVSRAAIEDGELFSLTYTALRGSGKRFRTGYGRFFAFAKSRIRGAVTRFWHSQDTVKHASLHESEDYDVEHTAEHRRQINWENRDDDNAIYDLQQPEHYHADVSRLDVVEFNESLERILPIIEDKLDSQEQMVLDLVFIAGFTFEEVGELLDISRSAVQLTRTRALKKIRAELAAQTRLLR